MATTVGVFLVSPTSWDIHLVKQSLWSRDNSATFPWSGAVGIMLVFEHHILGG